MLKITLKVDGMMCAMCEAHATKAIQENFKTKKVTSSHKNKETVIITANDIADSELKAAIAEAGYEVTEIARDPYEKKGLFASLRK